jgi:hypothetical protein
LDWISLVARMVDYEDAVFVAVTLLCVFVEHLHPSIICGSSGSSL